MANKPKPYAVQLLEASMQARLRNMVVERDKLSATCERAGLVDRPMFYTAQEVDEMRAEHDAEIKAFAISMYDPRVTRVAALVQSVNSPAARRAWAETQAAAEAIVDADEEDIHERLRIKHNAIRRTKDRR